MNIEEIDFENEKFDGIWAMTSLLHIPKNKIKNIITQLHDLLNEKGILFICLKEGDFEGFVEDGFGGKRFFKLWQKEEFLKVTKNYFELVDFKKVNSRNRVFLEFYFIKK